MKRRKTVKKSTAIALAAITASATISSGMYDIRPKVVFAAEETTESSEAENTENVETKVIESFQDENAIENWTGEIGYQYFHGADTNAAPEIAYDANDGDGRLKVSLDYTQNSGESWSEAKIKYIAPENGIIVKDYNQLSVDLIYPEGENSISKIKMYSNGIIDKDTVIDFENAVSIGDGYKKVTVTMDFSATEEEMKELTIGLIGSGSNFKGDVYLDNLTLLNKSEIDGYVKITSEIQEQNLVDLSKAAKKVKSSDDNLGESAKALLAYLKGLDANDQVLFGHQNDISRAVGTRDELGDVHDITGSISGVFGIDSLALTGSEAGGTDSESALRCAVDYSKKAAENGAIITLSAHMPNFTNGKIIQKEDGSYDFFNCDFNESKDLSNDSLKKILPGGEYNKVYRAYLDIIANYAGQLQEEGIPVMFRPLHENTGGWFWWGAMNAEESYKSLYRYTREYLENSGIHNMIYIYSPNGPVSSEEEFMTRYPGDEYVDILAFDYYDDYNSYSAVSDGSYFNHLDQSCQVVSGIAKKHDKIAAIAECGVRVMKKDGSNNEGLLVEGNPVSKEKTGRNWYQEVSDIAKKNDMPYCLVWANFGDTNFYVPYKYNEEYGQEMINEFIDYYNDESSVFGNETNFYANEGALAAGAQAENYTNPCGYLVYPFDMDELTEDATLKAYVKNAQSVEFVVKDTKSGKEVRLTGEARTQTLEEQQTVGESEQLANSKLYTAQLTNEKMEEFGKTDVAEISVVADGTQVATISNISVGKQKDVAAKNTFEDFDYYSGSEGLLKASYTENSAAGCSSSFSLDTENKSDGTYGGAFHYKLQTTGSEVWTGNIKSELSNHDFSEYNAIQLWVKPDGKGQKLVVQLADGSGEEFEAFLTNFVKGTEAKYITIPFDKLKGKKGGAIDPSNITKFAVWCNSYPSGEATDIESTIYMDGIRAVKITEEQADMTDEDGLLVTDEAIGEPKIEEPGEEEPGEEKPGEEKPDEEEPGEEKPGEEKPGEEKPKEEKPISSQVQKPEGTKTPSTGQSKTSTTNTKQSPKTGDESNIVLWAAGCVAGAVLFVLGKKKRKNKNINE